MALGYTINLPEDDRYLISRDDLLKYMCQALGGRAAEELVFGDVTTGAQDDLRRVSDMARQMVCEYGMSDELGPVTYGKKTGPIFLARELYEERNYSEEVAQRIDREVRQLVEGAIGRARSILTEHRDQLDNLVAVLLEKETLERQEVEAILKHGRLLEPGEEGALGASTDGKPSEPQAKVGKEGAPKLLPPPVPGPAAS
jgi:cell division protease FtsH